MGSVELVNFASLALLMRRQNSIKEELYEDSEEETPGICEFDVCDLRRLRRRRHDEPLARVMGGLGLRE